MLLEQATASYQRDLGDGLVLRWSNPDDAERLAQLMGTVWRSSADAPLNPRLMEVVRRHMRGEYPLVTNHQVCLHFRHKKSNCWSSSAWRSH
jgi:hypothetical protein